MPALPDFASAPEPIPEPGRQRRHALTSVAALASLTCAGAMAPAWAVRPRADSPTVATEPLLIDTGLGARWGQAMRQDLGWAAKWLPASTRQVLDRLESGDAEVGLHLSHPRAAWLEKEGLIHDRRRLLQTEVWLIGPANDPAGIRGEKDPARAIAQVLAAQAAGVARWQTDPPGEADGPLSALARSLLGAHPLPTSPAVASAQAPVYRLSTQAAWLRAGAAAKDLRAWFRGHPAMVLHAEVARSFRGKHPGGRLMVDWLDRPLARRAVLGVPGWQAARG